jgi:outer membrane protein assembly factor BamB
MGKLEYCAPVVQDGVAYFTDQSGGKAVKLPAQAADKIKPEELWKVPMKNDRYYASPLIHDGVLYAVMQQGVFSAVDAQSGKVLYEQPLKLGGTVYTSVTLAGKYLYVNGENGTAVVLEAGREFKEVGRNTLERYRSCPVFAGKRMYVRTAQNLWCIGE